MRTYTYILSKFISAHIFCCHFFIAQYILFDIKANTNLTHKDTQGTLCYTRACSLVLTLKACFTFSVRLSSLHCDLHCA